MSKQEKYPVIGQPNHKQKWFLKPVGAPMCIAPGCAAKATYKPRIEVNWFREDDEQSGPVCKAHSVDAEKLMEWTQLRKAENRNRLNKEKS